MVGIFPMDTLVVIVDEDNDTRTNTCDVSSYTEQYDLDIGIEIDSRKCNF